MKHHDPIHLVLVEDDDEDFELTTHALRSRGLVNEIHRVQDGAVALELLRSPEMASRPTLVLLDIQLPRMDGIEFLRALRADTRLAETRVAMLTSSPRDRDGETCESLGVLAYFSKPIDVDRLQGLAGQAESIAIALVESPRDG